VPDGELDHSSYLELGNVDISTYGGWVFAWEREAATFTRYSVRDDFSLFQDGEKLSFLSYSGGGEFVGGELALISATRAYTLSSELDVVVIWNPTTMEITGTIPMQPPDVPEGFVSFAHHPAVVGDKVIWEIVSTNDETEELHNSVRRIDGRQGRGLRRGERRRQCGRQPCAGRRRALDRRWLDQHWGRVQRLPDRGQRSLQRRKH
jgi:hypothetical protein